MATSNINGSDIVVPEQETQHMFYLGDSPASDVADRMPATADGPANSTTIDLEGNHSVVVNVLSPVQNSKHSNANSLGEEIEGQGHSKIRNSYLTSSPIYQTSNPTNHQSCSSAPSVIKTRTLTTDNRLGSSFPSTPSSILVHSVLRSTSKEQSSVVYWDQINDLLDTQAWKRLEKLAANVKNETDLLLTDNYCLSISKFSSFNFVTFCIPIIFI